MEEYANFYRFGARNQGGGSPIRDETGNVISNHVPFSYMSQRNGGIEYRTQPRSPVQQS